MQTFTTHYPPRPADLTGLEVDEPDTEQNETETAQESNRVFVRPEMGEGGRPPDEIDPGVIAAIQGYKRDNGDWPSLSWVYRLTKANLPTGGYNRDKARRALVAAGMEASDGQRN